MVSLENISVGALLTRTCTQHEGRPAVWYKDTVWCYARLLRETMDAAGRFLSMGIKRGDHVGIWGEIEPDTLAAYLGLQQIGAIAVVLNTSLGENELRDRLSSSDTPYLLVGQSYKNTWDMGAIGASLAKSMPLRAAYAIGEACPAPLTDWRTIPVADASAVEQAAAQVMPQDTAVILFTSGSTSIPKAVMSSHYSRVNGGIQQAADLACSCEDKFCVATPMFHCFCISANIMSSIAVGGCLCIPIDRHVASITATVEKCRCTVLSGVPTLYRTIISKPDFDPTRLQSLRIGIIGGSSYAPEAFLQYENALHMTLMSSLGQTETTAGLSICYIKDSPEVRSTTVGHFMDHVEGKIIDVKTGEALPVGRIGEICVRGYLTMQGYYKQPEATAQTLDSDGFVHTGDLGSIDANGNITLHGRLKELIIRGGENISPVEIEAALGKLPAIDICKVVGVPDEHFGEQICACIRCHPGAKLDAQTVKDHLRGLLASFKVPEYVVFMDEFPLSSTGKIIARETARLAAQKLGIG